MADEAALHAAQQSFIKEVWGLQAATYVVVGMRFYTRIKTLGWTNLQLDDYIMGSLVVSITPPSHPPLPYPSTPLPNHHPPNLSVSR